MTLTKRERYRATVLAVVTIEDVIRSLHDLISVVASIPEGERLLWYRAMTYTLTDSPASEYYDLHEAAKLWLRLAASVWAVWPPQDPLQDPLPGDRSGPTGHAPAAPVGSSPSPTGARGES